METRFDFLRHKDNDINVENARLRKEAITILESYNQEWDILSELFQNSIDAIDQNTSVVTGNINFIFDTSKRCISIRDNGIGIKPDELIRIFKPSVSYKNGRNSLRGEKGVGLSFLLFSTNNFTIESCDGRKKIVGKIFNAFDWAMGYTDDIPELLMTEEDSSAVSYTQFTLLGISSIQQDLDIFNFNLGRLKHTLRTKTAAGNTSILFGENPNKPIEISISFVDEKGNNKNETLPYSYDAPSNYIKPNLSFKERQQRLSQNDVAFVTGKAVHDAGNVQSISGRPMKYYYFICSRIKYSEMSKQILGSEDKDFVKGGIFLSTKTMPTGIQIPPPTIGKEGYWLNFYIVIEYDALSLDMGRKSVPSKISKMIKDQAEAIYKQVANHLTSILDTDNEIEDILTARNKVDSIWEDLSSVDNLNVKELNFFKKPQSEQSVVSIFHELIGKGKLIGYSTWRSNTKDQYDAFVKYRKDKKQEIKTIIEFKYDGSDIIKDIQDGIKDYSMINLLVCWTFEKK